MTDLDVLSSLSDKKKKKKKEDLEDTVEHAASDPGLCVQAPCWV